MAYQSAVSSFFTAPAVPGEIIFNGPAPSVESRIINSSAATDNVFGYVLTEVSGGDVQTGAVARTGGTGVVAGILVQPKAAATFGTTAGGPLAATLVLPDNSTSQVLKQGRVAVVLPNASNIGDVVTYNTTTGAIADTFAATAAFTAAQSTTTLTVSAITAGNIGVGSVIKNASGEILGTVIALGTGTGGTGTYTLNTSATVASAAMTANSQATTASTKLIPNTVVDTYAVTSGAVGIIYVNLT